jgi:hypothetical protein
LDSAGAAAADSLPNSENSVQFDLYDFSSEESESSSLVDIEKPDSRYLEQAFNIRAILDQLARISIALRRSGTRYRYQKADASYKDENYGQLKTHLAFIVATGTMPHHEGQSGQGVMPRLPDLAQLTPIQDRLIHANAVRHNRIIFATEPIKRTDARDKPEELIAQDALAPAVALDLRSREAAPAHTREPVRRANVASPSVVRSATEIGSQFNIESAVAKETPSVVTKITRIGATQDYPRCPAPISGNRVQCPYCADLLPVDCYKNQSIWR